MSSVVISEAHYSCRERWAYPRSRDKSSVFKVCTISERAGRRSARASWSAGATRPSEGVRAAASRADETCGQLETFYNRSNLWNTQARWPYLINERQAAVMVDICQIRGHGVIWDEIVPIICFSLELLAYTLWSVAWNYFVILTTTDFKMYIIRFRRC